MGDVTRLPASEDEWAPIIVEHPGGATETYYLAKTEDDVRHRRETVKITARPVGGMTFTFSGRVPATWWEVIARIQGRYADSGALPEPEYVITVSGWNGRVIRMSPVSADGA